MAINTISNIGTGSQWFKQLVGTDAQFRTIVPGTGISASQGTDSINVSVNQASALTWTGVQNFGTPSGSYTARFNPAYGDFYINRSNNLPYNPSTFEYNAFGADITYSSGSFALVPFRAHATADGGFASNAWGIATEATNAFTINDHSTTQLFGAEVAVINRTRRSDALRHAGLLTVFKNRGDDQNVPLGSLPTGGEAFNKKSRAVYIDSGGRVGKIGSPDTGNSAIECGWQTGIYFDAKSLDSAGSDGKAVGIDLTQLSAAAPEGGTFADRVKSGLALATGMPVTLSTDFISSQIRFVSATGNTEFAYNGDQRFGVNMNNGCVYMSAAGETANRWFIDFIGLASPNALFNCKSGSRIATSATAGAATQVAPAGYLKINIDNAAYKLAFYLN